MGKHEAGSGRETRTRRMVASGAVVCIGILSGTATPTANAAATNLLAPSIIDGHGNSQQINVLGNNILGPELGIGRSNTSRNSTSANSAHDLGNGTEYTGVSGAVTIVVSCGGVVACANVGYGNTVQVNFLGSNIYDPQIAFGADNTSINTTHSNFAERNGNGIIAAMPSGLAFAGGIPGRPLGNGNAFQVNILSANIANPQFSFGGSNTSTNSTSGNVSRHNGNNSTAATQTALSAGVFAPMLGNGNSIQINILSNSVVLIAAAQLSAIFMVHHVVSGSASTQPAANHHLSRRSVGRPARS